MDRWYSPAQAIRYSPQIVRWLLSHYWEFLHRGCWPPKHEEGCEAHNRTLQASHAESSAIAGELMMRLKSVGRVGTAIFLYYTGMETVKALAHIMGWTEWSLNNKMKIALAQIWKDANPKNFNERCPCCGEFLSKNHTCPIK